MSVLATINVKASNDQKYAISIAVSETVLSLKGKVAAKSDTPVERMRLIYSGRVLKDNDTLESYKITEGHTVHMVRSAAPAPAAIPTPATTTAATATPTATTRDPIFTNTAAALPNPWANLTGGGGMSGMGGFGGMGAMGGGNGMDPAMMSQMMQDPNFAQYMSSMLQNPRIMESMISMNPALQSMGPEVQRLLSSPQFRQMVTNPDALRQVAQMGAQMGGGIGGMRTFGGAEAGLNNPWTGASPASTPPTSTLATAPGAAGTTLTPAFNPFPTLGGAAAAANPMSSYWAQQMAAMGGRATTSTPDQTLVHQPPEGRFQVQLKQLNDMGFWDSAKNIRALLAAGGNVNGAIEILFSGAV